MRSSIAFFTVFAFLLVTLTVEARKDPGEDWRDVIKDEAMQEAIQKLLHAEIASSVLDEKTNYHSIAEMLRDKQKLFKDFKERNEFAVKELIPRPDISIYHDDETTADKINRKLETKAREEPCDDHQKEIAFAKDFKADPMISTYHD